MTGVKFGIENCIINYIIHSASCKTCSFVCMHFSKCLVGKVKTPSVQVAVEAGCMVASHVCTQEYIRDKSAKLLIPPSIPRPF